MMPFIHYKPWTPSWARGKHASEEAAYSKIETTDSETNSVEDGNSEKGIQSTNSAQRSAWTFRIVTIFIFAILNLSMWLAIGRSTNRARPEGVADRLFPQAEYETVIFHDDHLAPGPETEEVWQASLPRGHGFTIIDNPDYYGLPKGVAYADGFNQYGVSWAHQYHCVWMLKEAFWDLVNQNSSLIGVDIREKSEAGEELWHLAHCFGYLRQHIVCNMDMSLEYPTLGGANTGTINGYEIPHQCKRREPLDAYMDKHAPDPKLQIKRKKPSQHSHHEIIKGN